MSEQSKPEEGRLYVYRNGVMEVIETTQQPKLPIPESAMKEVKNVRNELAKNLGLRPELSIVAGAMILHAATADSAVLLDAVRELGQEIYANA